MFRQRLFHIPLRHAVILTALTLLVIMMALVGNLPGSIHTVHAADPDAAVEHDAATFVGRGRGGSRLNMDADEITHDRRGGGQVITGTVVTREAGNPGEQIAENQVTTNPLGEITHARLVLEELDASGRVVRTTPYDTPVPTPGPVPRIALDLAVYYPPFTDIRTVYYPNEFVQVHDRFRRRPSTLHEFIRIFNPNGVAGSFYELHIHPHQINAARTPVGHLRTEIGNFQREETELITALRDIGLGAAFYGFSWLALYLPPEIARGVLVAMTLGIGNTLVSQITRVLASLRNLRTIEVGLVRQYNAAADAIGEPTITWTPPTSGFYHFIGYLRRIFSFRVHEEL